MDARFRCRCCGARSLLEDPNGSYEICDECGWEDDPIQSGDPDYAGGANGSSLNQYREELVLSAAQQEYWRHEQHGSPIVRIDLDGSAGDVDMSRARDWMSDAVRAGGCLQIAARCDAPPAVIVTISSATA